MERFSSQSEKTPWTRAKRWWCLLIMFLMLVTFMLTFYISRPKVSWSLKFWTRLKSSQSHDDMTPAFTTSPEDPSPYFVPYPHRYRFILDEPHRCLQERPFLVLVIPVAPHNIDSRDTIRNTWGKETTVLGQVVSHYFLLGLSKKEDETATLKEQLLEESQRHHDILQSDFLDSYNNLTIKTMVMFEWLDSHCPYTSYAMKIDSDMFLNVHNLVDLLLKAPKQLYMTGMVVRNAFVVRNPTSKWFMPYSAFSGYMYPPYAMGLGYVLSLDLPKKILEASEHVRAVYIEDVYVGLCMEHLGIQMTDPPRGDLFRGFRTHWTSDCYWTSVITTILQTSKQLSEAWKAYCTVKTTDC
ncbi:beta-1,3-galactosyltransferase 5-like [Eleginops maclovinus]|uniref:beta-1,3-galactosyltransferase 5-like n=1 Tax=Eleginops maclovinus TaxID=56733 RepID=UPI0030810683